MIKGGNEKFAARGPEGFRPSAMIGSDAETGLDLIAN
jgi:hypothetical protein